MIQHVRTAAHHHHKEFSDGEEHSPPLIAIPVSLKQSLKRLSFNRAEAEIPEKIPPKESEITPLRFISFEYFKRLKNGLPRYPENRKICTTLDKIHKKDSFIVYISHAWLRRDASCEDYDLLPHPDTKKAIKYRLCCEGISRLWKKLAPGMKYCYVWIDFGCLNQSLDPVKELERLERVMEYADCMFTPLCGPRREGSSSQKAPSSSPSSPVNSRRTSTSSSPKTYDASSWNGDTGGYINRGRQQKLD